MSKKTLQVTKITLADSQDNARDGQIFAIAELQEVGKSDKVSKLKQHSVIVANTFNWLIDIVGESDEFTTCIDSIHELTNGSHKGFKVVDNDDYGVITSRNLVGYESEEELKSRELGRLNRHAGDTIEWVDEEEAE